MTCFAFSRAFDIETRIEKQDALNLPALLMIIVLRCLLSFDSITFKVMRQCVTRRKSSFRGNNEPMCGSIGPRDLEV